MYMRGRVSFNQDILRYAGNRSFDRAKCISVVFSS